jgi:hypothetical protein
MCCTKKNIYCYIPQQKTHTTVSQSFVIKMEMLTTIVFTHEKNPVRQPRAKTCPNKENFCI